MDTDADTTLHIVEDPDGWCLLEGENGDVLRRFDTKAQALTAARRLAVERGVEVVVHGSDGSIQERDMFVR